jgi:hypothetical protein
MIIKRYTGSTFVELYPKTVAQKIFDAAGTTAVFDTNNKIKPAYLPDSVFDSLYFYATANSSSTLIQLGASAYGSSFNLTRSVIGFYAVASEAMDITRNFTATLLNFTTLVANITQGNTTITLTADTTTKGLAVGNVLTGNAFIPEGTTITSITNETQFVISNAPTGNQSSGVISFNAYFRSAIQYGEELNTYVRTFNLTSGSTTVTGGDTNNLFAGMRVSGVGMPGGSTTIASITNSTTFVLAAAATANGESSLTFTNNTEFSSVAKLEPGDWFIITEFYGTGTIGFPFTSVWTIVNNTYEIMKGATESTAGAPGIVPAPLIANRLQFLKGDGTWQTPVTDLSYTSAIASGVVGSSTGNSATIPAAIAYVSEASVGAAGLLTNTDKAKLDGVATGANLYVHPNHSGDVTSTGDGATVIGAGKVLTSMLADNAVETAKIKDLNVTTDKLAADAVTNAKLADDAVETANILNLNVTTAKLAADAVTNAKLADNAVDTENIVNEAVTLAKLQQLNGFSVIGRSAGSDGATQNIVATVNEGDAPVLRVSGGTLGFGQIETAGITNDAVTNAKLANIAAYKIKGNNTASAADPLDLTTAQVRTMTNTVAVFYQSSAPTLHADGSALQEGTLWFQIPAA